ncbi:MAG: hypothetical protein IJE08_10760 [Clostridia bacterium]|nr:hypothetical protein [Clostridia bacterium]
MDRGRMKPVPLLFPGMGNPWETEIRRVEFDPARGTRSERGGAVNAE